MMFRRFKSGADEPRWGKSAAIFSTRLKSADRGLCFDARFTYEWRPVAETGPLLHGDAVAQTLMGSAAAAVARRYEIFLVGAAQAAVNSALSREMSADPRLLVTGVAALSITEETAAAARGRRQAAERLWADEAVTTEKLEILRERLLDHRLGLAWWIDRFADLQFAAGNPATKAEAVVSAFETLTRALRADRADAVPDEKSMIRARVEELLTALEDPVTGQRAADLLEVIIRTLAPPTASNASDALAGSY
ncbi:hypothetical protein N4G69_15510 [Streptomyces mirabilis]|uniref:hypothetical protein n=1 Tax=Streptomyces mirabilis TaxID=68239 RepID=UPI0021C14563|nr:hypothetical protein [Streptomyces mirabilis]MCT9107024.1 hypothetical protein [Streptomyces mirabilis]